MKQKFSCADFTFPLLPHDIVLDLISKMEFDGVDIGLLENRSHLQLSAMSADISGNARILRRKLEDRNLKPADVFLQTTDNFMTGAVNHPDIEKREEYRDMFLKTLEFADACGCKHVTGLPGAFFDGESEDVSFERCCKELSWRCEEAAKHGIVFSVEAHFGSIAPTPEKALNLVENVPGLTLTLDYSHYIRQGIENEKVMPLIRHTSHFHARGACKGMMQAPVSQNTIDYEKIVQHFKQQGYKGYICMEYTWSDWENCKNVDNVSETILLRDMLRRLYVRN